MNCYNHPDEVSVATCVDCGKGLCKTCASLYQMPICNECNLRRVKSDKGNLARIYLPSGVLFVLGAVLGIFGGNIGIGIGLGYVLAGIPWGWKALSFIQPKIFLFLSFAGWIIYFIIKLLLSSCVGIAALPIGIIKLVIGIVSVTKNEGNINTNMGNA